jgi:hypothetical protein
LGDSIATYLVSGERSSQPPPTQGGDYEMDDPDEEEEAISKIEMLLVAQSELEGMRNDVLEELYETLTFNLEIKSQMIKVYSVHIHSLGAAVIRVWMNRIAYFHPN